MSALHSHMHTAKIRKYVWMSSIVVMTRGSLQVKGLAGDEGLISLP